MRILPPVTIDEALELAEKSTMLGVMLDEAIREDVMEHALHAYASLQLVVTLNAALHEQIQHLKGVNAEMERGMERMAAQLDALNVEITGLFAPCPPEVRFETDTATFEAHKPEILADLSKSVSEAFKQPQRGQIGQERGENA